MTHRRRLDRPLVSWLLAVGLLAPAVRGQDTAPPAAPAPPVAEIPLEDLQIDLGGIDAVVADQISTTAAEVERLLAIEPLPGAELVSAYGLLGRLFAAVGQLEPARTAFRNAARLSDDFLWRHYLGLAAQSLGDYPGAAAAYRDALERNPAYLPARIRLAEAHLELGEIAAAKEQLEAAVAVEPEHPAVLRGLGEVALREGRAAEAVEYLEKALAASPEADVLHYSLAEAHRQLGHDDQARRHASLQGDRPVPVDDPLALSITRLSHMAALAVAQARAGADDFSEPAFLGYVHRRLAPIPGAAGELGREIERLLAAPDAAGDRQRQGRLLWARAELLALAGAWDEVREVAELAVSLAPELVGARLLLAEAANRAADPEAAVGWLEAALERDPGNRRGRILLAESLTRLRRFDAAVAQLERLRSEYPDEQELRLRIGGVLEQAGRHAEALAAYSAAAAEGRTRQEQASGQLALAALHRRLGDVAAAREAYAAARELDPASVPALVGAANLEGATGDFATAAELYRQAVELEPRSEEVRRAEAAALILAGRHAEVAPRLEEGLALLPGSRQLQELLARHLASSPLTAVRDGARAVEVAEALDAGGRTPATLETLAMAYAQRGDFARAVELQERLLASLEGQAASASALAANLELYRQGRPCCAAP